MWAPPGRIWGNKVKIEKASNIGVTGFTISFNTISQAPSTFELEISYWHGNQQKHDIVIGPGEYSFTMDCACVTWVRARSYSLGQMIEVNIDGS